jgi:hypothetical protein
MSILTKYSYNTFYTCHFSIKKIIQKLSKTLKQKFYFLFFYFLEKTGVWGGVIFQPRLNLPDTLPVIVRLQHRDECLAVFFKNKKINFSF